MGRVRFIIALLLVGLSMPVLASRSLGAAICTIDGTQYPATIVGAGTITGTPGNDVIFGSRGPDTIFGNGGNDVVCGRDGSDVIKAGTDLGANLISGDLGDDVIVGSGGPGWRRHPLGRGRNRLPQRKHRRRLADWRQWPQSAFGRRRK
jgi:Ca2+-binding RTX toxin-like protein